MSTVLPAISGMDKNQWNRMQLDGPADNFPMYVNGPDETFAIRIVPDLFEETALNAVPRGLAIPIIKGSPK